MAATEPARRVVGSGTRATLSRYQLVALPPDLTPRTCTLLDPRPERLTRRVLHWFRGMLPPGTPLMLQFAELPAPRARSAQLLWRRWMSPPPVR